MSGLPELNGDWLNERTPVVRWVAITPEGEVEVHESENRLAMAPDGDGWWQWRLFADIYAVVDPLGHCADHWTDAWDVVDDEGGVFIDPCGHPRSALPANPLASQIIASATGQWCKARGTVVWLGGADESGVHVCATDRKIAELRAFAERARLVSA